MIEIKRLADVDLKDVSALEKAFETIEPNIVACCNWPGQFGYVPEFSFRMFHTGNALAIRYQVREKCTAALVSEDNGQVWTDSCCEFFFQPYGTGKYYNLEATCIGKILLAHRSGRLDAVHAPQSVLSTVGRFASLGSATFDERNGDNSWSLIITVPVSALFEDEIKTFSGLKGRFNLYKCGDNLSQPHYISFFPINTENPDFHRPEFFGAVEFKP